MRHVYNPGFKQNIPNKIFSTEKASERPATPIYKMLKKQ